MIASRRRLSEHTFFLWVAATIAVLVFAGFARTYYLKSLFHTPRLTTLVHVHAAVMTLWILFFVVQTALVYVRRIAWHRLLGWIGVGDAALVVILGATTTWHAAAREVRGHTNHAPSRSLFWLWN